MRSRWEILMTVGVGLLAAILGFVLLQSVAVVYRDYQTFHQLLGLINYNLSVGKLEAIPVPTGPAPPSPPVSPPAPTPSPKP